MPTVCTPPASSLQGWQTCVRTSILFGKKLLEACIKVPLIKPKLYLAEQHPHPSYLLSPCALPLLHQHLFQTQYLIIPTLDQLPRASLSNFRHHRTYSVSSDFTARTLHSRRTYLIFSRKSGVEDSPPLHLCPPNMQHIHTQMISQLTVNQILFSFLDVYT